MSLDLKTAKDTSATALVSGIIQDAQDLMRQQFNLFQHEVRNDLRKTKEATLILGMGHLLGQVGAILVALAMTQLLERVFPAIPLWACYALGGLPFLIAGAGLFYAGKAKVENLTKIPTESMLAFKENVRWMENQN